jgi:hypothetical protein
MNVRVAGLRGDLSQVADAEWKAESGGIHLQYPSSAGR